MVINKPVEELVGDNYGIVRMRCGHIHVMTPIRKAIREVRKGVDRESWKEIPRPLRRGFIKCVIDTMAEYRGTYIAVMTGNLG